MIVASSAANMEMRKPETDNLDKTGFSSGFWISTIISFLINGYFVMFSSVTLMYGNDAHLSPGSAGFLASSFSLAMLVMRPFSGMICDRFRRETVLLISMIGYTIGPLVFLFPVSYSILIAARIWEGLSMGVALTAASTLATEALPKSKMAEGIGYFGISTAASGSLAPGIGLSILNHFGYKGVFIFGSLIGIAIVFLTLSVKKPTYLQMCVNLLSTKAYLIGLLKGKPFLEQLLLFSWQLLRFQ